MSEIDSSYQPAVGINQGADTIFVKDSGNLKFYDTDYDGEYMRNMMRSMYTVTLTSMSGSVALSGGGNDQLTQNSVIPKCEPCRGTHRFALSVSVTNGSWNINDAEKGDFLIVDGRDLQSTVSITIDQTSVNSASIYTLRGSRVSSILLLVNANSALRPYLKMVCSTDGQWSVAENNSLVTVRPE